MGILSLLLWTPALGVLFLAAIPNKNSLLIRLAANGFGGCGLALTVWLLSQYDVRHGELQFYEHITLNPALGSAYALGVDGLSLPLLLLTTALVSVALMLSDAGHTAQKSFTICILALEFGLIGVFSSQNWVLLFLFWQLAFIALFFLLNRWGGLRRQTASLRFVLYTLGSSVFLLISLLAIHPFDLPQDRPLMDSIYQTTKTMPMNQQILVLLGFVLGFGVNMALFPVHGWLALAQTTAPAAINILVSGVFINLGAYGLFRVLVMMPAAAQALQPVLTALALFGMVYGGLLAWRQTELNSLLAYWSTGQMAMVLLGITSLDSAGLSGAALTMVAHGLVAAALYLLAGSLYRRNPSLNLFAINGQLMVSPKFSLLMVLSLLAAMAIPGSAGFIALIHTLVGSARQQYPVLMVFLLVGLITASYLIRTMNQLFLSPGQEIQQKTQDLAPIEWALSGGLVLAIILLGLVPAPWLELSAATIKYISTNLHLPAW